MVLHNKPIAANGDTAYPPKLEDPLADAGGIDPLPDDFVEQVEPLPDSNYFLPLGNYDDGNAVEGYSDDAPGATDGLAPILELANGVQVSAPNEPISLQVWEAPPCQCQYNLCLNSTWNYSHWYGADVQVDKSNFF